MLKFQEEILKKDLGRLPPRSRVAFAASCAQRLSDAYRSFLHQTGRIAEAALCDHAIDYVWNHILVPPDNEIADRLVVQVAALIPDQDASGWTAWTAFGDDALSALTYCLKCLRKADPQEAAWAAARAYDALDFFVTTRDNISPSNPGAENLILGDPVIQTEFGRQARDMADLSSAGDRLSQELIDNLRRRSLTEQAIPISWKAPSSPDTS